MGIEVAQRVYNLETYAGVYVAGGVLVHNCQRAPAETCFASIDPFTARYRIGTSADESRKDEKQFLTYDLFGEPIARATEEETLASGKTVEVECLLVPTKFEAPWYRYRQDWNKLLYQMTEDAARNEQILKLTGRAVQEGQQVLLFSHRVEHVRMIDARLNGLGVRCGTLLGGVDNAEQFRKTRDALKAGDYRAGMGTYQAIAQGTDIPSVTRGICTTPITNNRQTVGQVRGRICRSSTGKVIGRLAFLYDRAIYGRRAVENLVEWQRVVRVWHGGEWLDGREYLKFLSRYRAA